MHLVKLKIGYISNVYQQFNSKSKELIEKITYKHLETDNFNCKNMKLCSNWLKTYHKFTFYYQKPGTCLKFEVNSYLNDRSLPKRIKKQGLIAKIPLLFMPLVKF